MPRQEGKRSDDRRQGSRSRSGGDIHIHTNGNADRRDTSNTSRQGKTFSRADTDAFVNRLIRRYGTAEDALSHLAGEQLRYRQRAQEAEQRAEDAESGLPPQGAVVLEGEEAEEYNKLRTERKDFSFKGLGDVLKEHGEMKVQTAKAQRAKTLATVAGDRYKPKVLERILGDVEFSFKTRIVPDPEGEDEDATKEIQVAFVKHEDGTSEQFDDWFRTEHPEFYDLALVKDTEDAGTRDQEDKPSKGESRVPPQRRSTSADSSRGRKATEDKKLGAVVASVTNQYMSPAQRKAAAAGNK